MSSKDRSVRFDAVVLYLAKEADAAFLKELIRKVSHAPVKICVGQDFVPAKVSADFQPFSSADVEGMKKFMKQKYDLVTESLKKVFDGFVKEKEGKIKMMQVQSGRDTSLSGKHSMVVETFHNVYN